MAVVVPAKEQEKKMGIIITILQSVPDEFPFSINEIKNIIKRSYEEITMDNARRFLVALVKLFSDGLISREEFAVTAEGLVSYNKLEISENDWLYEVVYHDLPDMCICYVDEPGCEADKEFGFRKAIKNLDRKLKYEGQTPIMPTWKIQHDPVEDSEIYQRIELDVERKINAELGKERYMGCGHLYWFTKKRILKKEHGIEWKSPAEMNPLINFD